MGIVILLILKKQKKIIASSGPAEGIEVEPLELSKKELVLFNSWEKFLGFNSDGYYWPR